MDADAEGRDEQNPLDHPELVSEADKDAANRMLEKMERELRKLAANHLRRERHEHTLQPTALMNEAIIRLMTADGAVWRDRNHFFAVASTAMRHALVDHARKRNASKRQPDRVVLQYLEPSEDPVSIDALDLHLALEEFAVQFPLGARLVELRFFGGLAHSEAAEVLNLSERGADEEWKFAKAWLKRRLRQSGKDESASTRC